MATIQAFENIKLALQAKRSAHEARKKNRLQLRDAILAFLTEKSDTIVSNINHNPACWHEVWIQTDIVASDHRIFSHEELATLAEEIEQHTGITMEVVTNYKLVQIVFRF